MKEGQVLEEEAYQAALSEFGPNFKARYGRGESILDLLRKVDIEYLSRKIRMDLKETKSEDSDKKTFKETKSRRGL